MSKLAATLEHVRARRARLLDQAAKLQRIEQTIAEYLGEPAATPGREGDANPTQCEAAERALREAGGPLRTIELVKRMVERGHYQTQMSLRQLVDSVYTALARKSDTFVRVGRGVWGLREWAADPVVEEAGATPAPEGETPAPAGAA
jgi:hypothetical protein